MAALQKQAKKRVYERYMSIFSLLAAATHDCMDAGDRATQGAKAEMVF